MPRLMLHLNELELSFVKGLAQEISTPLQEATPQEAIRSVLGKLQAKMAMEQPALPLAPVAPLRKAAGVAPARARKG